MINIRNTSTLIAAIACAANAATIRTNLQSSAADSEYVEISEDDQLLLSTGEELPMDFQAKFWLTEGDNAKKTIHKFVFTLQEDGNLVLYRHDDGGEKAIWASDTNGKGDNLKLWLQEDGSLSLRHAVTNVLVWSTYTGGRGVEPYEFVMPDPGFPMVVDSKNNIIWAADQTESFCNKTWYIEEMLKKSDKRWHNSKKSDTFGFYRGNCGEPDFLIEDEFEGNFLKVYEEYEIEYDGDMVESTYLYVHELKLDYEGWYDYPRCYAYGSNYNHSTRDYGNPNYTAKNC